jgi:hypothetical protein
MYVKNWRGPSYDLTGTTATNTINSLAALMGGLPVPGGNAMAQGMQSWIDSQGLTDRFAVHQLGDSTPLDHTSVQNFITQAFSDNDAIQIGVAWSDTNGTLLTGTNTGSHILTLWGINTDGFSPHPLYGIDPWNNAILTFQIGQGPHGYFIVNYSNDGGASGTGGADGPDPDNPGHAVNGVVTFLTAEQALPEPASAGMGIMFVAAMGLARRRR